MSAGSAWPTIAVTEHWSDLNDHLIELVDLVPDGKLDWSSRPGEWGCRRLFLHIASARHHWLNESIGDGRHVGDLEVSVAGASRDDIKRHLATSWDRLAAFLTDEQLLSERFEPPAGDPWYVEPEIFDGHFIAFHRLVHDVHHRADIIRLLTLLGVELPADRRRRPL